MNQGYEALRAGVAWLDLSSRGMIFASGRDRVRLLHNISTNHIKGLAPGEGCYAFFLNVQGRIQADANILCLEDRLLLDTEPETREKLFAHIRKYIIADDVKLEDVTGQQAAVGVEGPNAAAVLSAAGIPAPEADYSHREWNNAIVARISATGEPGFRIYLPAGQMGDLVGKLEAAGAVAASPEEARIVRLEHGKPRYGEDITDTSLPQETQQMHAVHFSKGCYLGQEIVERIRARGHVNRQLTRLELEGAEVSTEDAQITSSVYSPALGKTVALAYVRAKKQE